MLMKSIKVKIIFRIVAAFFLFALLIQTGVQVNALTSFDCTSAATGLQIEINVVGRSCGVVGDAGVASYCGINTTVPLGRVEMLCTTNEFNFCPTNVCLIRNGDLCSFDWQCEGGTICDKEAVAGAANGVCAIDQGVSDSGGGSGGDIRDTARRFINIALGFLGVMVVIMIIYGGAMWLTSAGNDERVSKGKHILVWAAIGAIVITIAWTISSYVLKLGGSLA